MFSFKKTYKIKLKLNRYIFISKIRMHVKNYKIFLYVSACIRRKLDAKRVSDYLIKNKHILVDSPKDADYIIFFTCAFNETNVNQNLATIKKFKKYKAELIVAGCLPDIATEGLKKIFDGKIISTKNLEKIDEIFKESEVKFSEIDHKNCAYKNPIPIEAPRKLLWLAETFLKKISIVKKIYLTIRGKISAIEFIENNVKQRFHEDHFIIFISRGCIHKCSFCGIRRAIGPLKSKPLNQCVNEFKDGLRKGYKKFMLQADDASIYGIDIKSSLPTLLDEITKIEGDYTIILEELHPMWVIRYADDLEKIFKRKKIYSILVAIQSGSNRILQLMNRKYDKESLVNVLKRLRKANPNLIIGMQAIAGFPTETEEDFKDTLELIKNVRFNEGILFIYSDLEGTESAEMYPKVPMKEKHRRMKYASKYLNQNGFFTHYSRYRKQLTFDLYKK